MSRERLAGSIAVVTGGGSGIGKATCLLFAAEGATVVIADVDETAGLALAREISETGGSAEFVATDVADLGSCLALAAELSERHARVDVLVNNAGVRGFGTVLDVEASWHRVFEVNVMGAVYCSRALIPLMNSLGNGGSIVHVSSVMALRGRPGFGPYSVSKGALISLTKTMAADHAGLGIRVNCICPGATWNETKRQQHAGPEAQSVDDTSLGLLRRRAEASEIAHGILFLACADSSFMTGSVLTVDGGLSAI